MQSNFYVATLSTLFCILLFCSISLECMYLIFGKDVFFFFLCVGISPVSSNEDPKVNSQRYLLQRACRALVSHTVVAAVSKLGVDISQKCSNLYFFVSLCTHTLVLKLVPRLYAVTSPFGGKLDKTFQESKQALITVSENVSQEGQAHCLLF